MGAHNGQVSGATWTPGGVFGQSLSFDGINDWVTVPHNAALDLTGGMTLEAWVKPSALSTWRSVIQKERTGAFDYALYANTDTAFPSARVFTSSGIEARGPQTLLTTTWTHLAMSWDGTDVRLFVDGAEVAAQAAPGPLVTSTGDLRIGGNSLRSEWFSGLIDEVRVYNRPLTAEQITADMNKPVKP
jgi:hypothetical protein